MIKMLNTIFWYWTPWLVLIEQDVFRILTWSWNWNSSEVALSVYELECFVEAGGGDGGEAKSKFLFFCHRFAFPLPAILSRPSSGRCLRTESNWVRADADALTCAVSIPAGIDRDTIAGGQ